MIKYNVTLNATTLEEASATLSLISEMIMQGFTEGMAKNEIENQHFAFKSEEISD